MSFNAAYTGPCANPDCEGVRVGDLIEFVDQINPDVRHVTCPEPKPLPDPCPRCFMVPAANGTCECDA